MWRILWAIFVPFMAYFGFVFLLHVWLSFQSVTRIHRARHYQTNDATSEYCDVDIADNVQRASGSVIRAIRTK